MSPFGPDGATEPRQRGRWDAEAIDLHQWWFVLAGVSAAIAFGTSTHLKYLSARDVPAAHTLRPGAVGRLARASVAHRLWRVAIGADAVGLALQIVALHLGPISAVQPLLVLGLLVALLMHQRHRGRLRAAEIGWALLIAAALAAVIVLVDPSGSRPPAADPGPTRAAVVLGPVLAGLCLLFGRSRRGGRRAAVLLGVVVGGIYAATAALLKVIAGIGAHEPVSVLWHWQLYAALAAGAAGMLLNQVAFRAGPLTASLPAISTVDPLLSIVIGVWVFDEHVRGGPGASVALAGALVALVLGVINLVRTGE